MCVTTERSDPSCHRVHLLAHRVQPKSRHRTTLALTTPTSIAAIMASTALLSSNGNRESRSLRAHFFACLLIPAARSAP